MDQRRQVRPELDQVVLPQVRSQVRLALFVLAYNLANFMRKLNLKANLTGDDETLDSDQYPDQADQDGWAFGVPYQEASVSAC